MAAFALDLVSRVAIRAPRSRVWEVFADARDWPRYNPVVLEVGAVPDAWREGARLSYVLRMAGRRVGFSVEVTRCEPGREVTWSSRRWTVTGTRTFTFTERDGVVEVEDHKRFTCAWFPVGWLYPRPVIRRMSEAWLTALRDEAERTMAAGG